VSEEKVMPGDECWREIDDGICSDCDVPWEQCDCTFLAYECGMMADGTCLLAGSEDCDWECPRSRP